LSTVKIFNTIFVEGKENLILVLTPDTGTVLLKLEGLKYIGTYYRTFLRIAVYKML